MERLGYSELPSGFWCLAGLTNAGGGWMLQVVAPVPATSGGSLAGASRIRVGAVHLDNHTARDASEQAKVWSIQSVEMFRWNETLCLVGSGSGNVGDGIVGTDLAWWAPIPQSPPADRVRGDSGYLGLDFDGHAIAYGRDARLTVRSDELIASVRTPRARGQFEGQAPLEFYRSCDGISWEYLPGASSGCYASEGYALASDEGRLFIASVSPIAPHHVILERFEEAEGAWHSDPVLGVGALTVSDFADPVWMLPAPGAPNHGMRIVSKSADGQLASR